MREYQHVEVTKMLNEATVNKLEEALSKGASISAACFHANISRQTFYNWIKDNKDLEERFDSLKENPIMKALDTIYGNLGDKDTAKWYLERRTKEFKPKSDVMSDDKALPTPILAHALPSNNSNTENTETQPED